ncbi:MAG: zinc-binding dehydrogenase, partial [Myxococcota bacterium]
MKIPNTMKAACVHKQGDSRIVVEDVPTPEPGPGQILIRVDSAGVNFSDVKRRRGDAYPFETRFPFTPGGEVAGTVVAHGSGVENPPIGSEVFALSGADGTGGYAQFTLSYASTAVPKPNGMSFELASVLVVAGSTAKLLLSKTAKLAPGESVLIPAATGGVGSFLVQLARRMDAGRILAAVGDTAKRARALELGAHEVVDYSSPEWPERVRELTDDKGVDVALEASGGPCVEQTLRCLAPFGRLVVFGAASGKTATLSLAAIEHLLY